MPSKTFLIFRSGPRRRVSKDAPAVAQLPCSIFDTLEMLMENQRHREATRGITVPGASLMLGYSPFQTVTGCSDII